MKIIKKGADVSISHHCKLCGCDFLFQPGEVEMQECPIYDVPLEYTKKYGGQYGPCRIDFKEFVVCPCCKTKCFL